MDGLSDFYLREGKYKLDEVENEAWWLNALSLDAALETDLFSNGKQEGLMHLGQLVSIFKRYQLPADANGFSLMHSSFPYFALADAMRKDSDKELRKPEEIALEMDLMIRELESAVSNPEGATELLCDLATQFLYEADRDISLPLFWGRKYLVV